MLRSRWALAVAACLALAVAALCLDGTTDRRRLGATVGFPVVYYPETNFKGFIGGVTAAFLVKITSGVDDIVWLAPCVCTPFRALPLPPLPRGGRAGVRARARSCDRPLCPRQVLGHALATKQPQELHHVRVDVRVPDDPRARRLVGVVEHHGGEQQPGVVVRRQVPHRDGGRLAAVLRRIPALGASPRLPTSAPGGGGRDGRGGPRPARGDVRAPAQELRQRVPGRRHRRRSGGAAARRDGRATQTARDADARVRALARRYARARARAHRGRRARVLSQTSLARSLARADPMATCSCSRSWAASTI